MPAKSMHKMLLAVGKGSGSFEVWNCDIYNNNFDKFGSYDAHDNVVSMFFLGKLYAPSIVNLLNNEIPQVTGLAWAFDGSCLYSCSQVFQCTKSSCIIEFELVN